MAVLDHNWYKSVTDWGNHGSIQGKGASTSSYRNGWNSWNSLLYSSVSPTRAAAGSSWAAHMAEELLQLPQQRTPAIATIPSIRPRGWVVEQHPFYPFIYYMLQRSVIPISYSPPLQSPQQSWFHGPRLASKAAPHFLSHHPHLLNLFDEDA